MTKEVKQQFTLRISRANPTELVVILYEMAEQFLEEAKEAFAEENMVEYKEAIRKSRGCINELIQSLHMEYDPAPKLLKLYLFCIRPRVLRQSSLRQLQVLHHIFSSYSAHQF